MYNQPLLTYSSTIDLAGQVYQQPTYLQTQNRINHLVNHYLTFEELDDRLNDLPVQLENPQTRHWKAIDWRAIHPQQIVGIEISTFLSILAGCINTEIPIRGYTQASRQYLEKVNSKIAHFVGGTIAEDGTILELGLWEKEERKHAPALSKIYQQLTGDKFIPNPPNAKPYQPSDNPYEDLYLHGLHRVITEYAATCLYLWLMAHTTGALQEIFAELVQDEINHMTKFWGFGIWLFPESYLTRIKRTLGQIIILRKPTNISHLQSTIKLSGTFHHMMEVLSWHGWSLSNKAELFYTFIRVMHRLWRWNATLTPEYLQQLLNSEF